MTTTPARSPCWSTSSFGRAPDTTPQELCALGEHLSLCRGRHGRWSALSCAMQALRGIVAARAMTAWLVAGLLLAVVIAVS
ncbi:hypothetical protein [Sphaerotilus microaerophilus]|jgi:hypothetical protein|uniref:Uncharacterized protein n=1 Tax=Sphaerotilus microaerophilus TaxID=2914710 RepID=A0ABM7YL22_9BURK|nr:hypothetical protein [Sphaerotilus sp. FB-5]BDI05139.1 hypothetical protein CATMQ487_21090 [Sphaerotilus sp. FB-5]